MVNAGLRSDLQLHQPNDHVAIALAGAGQHLEPVQDALGQPDIATDPTRRVISPGRPLLPARKIGVARREVGDGRTVVGVCGADSFSPAG
jgi:hypothetical protein